MNTSEVRSSLYRPIHQFFFWLLVADYLVLGYLGQQVPESPFIEIGQLASVYYFAYFFNNSAPFSLQNSLPSERLWQQKNKWYL